MISVSFKSFFLFDCRYLTCLKFRTSFCSTHAPAIHKVQPSAASLRRRPKKPSFAKNLFLGVYDLDLLTFPEILDGERLKYIENLSLRLKSVCSLKSSEQKSLIDLKESVFQSFQDEVFKLKYETSYLYGGPNLTATEYAKLSEIIGYSPSLALLLEIQNSLVTRTIEQYGSQDQITRFLHKLETGEIMGAYALCEENTGSDPASLKMMAKFDFQSGVWNINGHKLWIANANVADIFIVFAKSELENRLEGSEELSAFIVEKGTPGITLEKHDMNCLAYSDLFQVNFRNVIVPKENMLGSPGNGIDIAVSNLSTPKFILCASVLTCLKDLLNKATKFLTHRKQYALDLRESEMIKERVGKIAGSVYALESTMYMTAGILDSYDTDSSLECAIMQALTFERGLEGFELCSSLFGARIFDKNFGFGNLKHDFEQLALAFQTVDILKLFISLQGLHFMGNTMQDSIKRSRNPLNYPSFVFKKILSNRRQINDSPKLSLELYVQLHLSLKGSAQQLEYCVLRLQYAAECLLTRHGSEVVNRQIELRRLADVVMDIYAMTAVLARSSRAYCTGIRFCDEEMILAKAYCQDACHRVKATVQDVIDGVVASSDMCYLKTANSIIKQGGYSIEHPLKQNIS